MKFNVKKTLIPALVIIVVIAAILLFLLRTGPKKYSNHVVVTEFLNQTGDPNFDRVGRLTAEMASRGLEELGLFGVAPLVKYDAGADNNLQAKDFRQIAKNADAAIVVSGELYMEGTSLVITSKIYDAVKQALLPSPDALSVPVDEISEVLDTLGDRLKSAMMGTHDPRVAMWQRISPYIPRYEAVLEFINGMEMYWNLQYLPATIHFDRAAEIDPDYFLAYAYALMAHAQSANIPKATQYLEKINKFSDLSPGESYLVDFFKAIYDGNIENAYLITRQLEALAPETTLSNMVASWAIMTNRPQVAIETLERLDPNSVYIACNYCYWDTLAMACHMIGDYEKELEAALRAEEQFPENWEPLWYKIRALSALGKLDEVYKVIEEILVKPITSDMFPASFMWGAAKEFKKKNHKNAEAEMYEQALSWLGQKEQKEGLTDDMKYILAWILSDTRRWDEAESIFQELIDSNPDNIDYSGCLGVLAARSGKKEEALLISERLKNFGNDPFNRGKPSYWQAAIEAHLGEKDLAVSLLLSAFRQGILNGYIMFYTRSALEPLWDYPAFIEFMKPRD